MVVSGPCENADIMTHLIKLKLLAVYTPPFVLTAAYDRHCPCTMRKPHYAIKTFESHCGVMQYPHGNEEWD